MANKRMFSKQITDSDAFVDMPATSQLLYFHLNMQADDDGFVSNPKRIIRMINVGDDDLKILLVKRFLLPFESGVVVIKHWLLHNAVRKDMYKETQYLEEKKMLQIKDNGVYTELRNDTVTLPLHRLDKIRLDKDRIDQDNTMSASADESSFNKFWSSYPKKELKKKSKEIWERKKLSSSLEEILKFITSAKNTDRWKKGFIKQAPTFLNGECWNDDLLAYQDKNNANNKPNNVLEAKEGKYGNYN